MYNFSQWHERDEQVWKKKNTRLHEHEYLTGSFNDIFLDATDSSTLLAKIQFCWGGLYHVV